MKTLLLFTSNYPFDNYTEAVFVRPELEALAQAYDRVVVIPRYPGRNTVAIDIANVSVDYSLAHHPFSRFKILKMPWLLHRDVLRRLSVVISEANGLNACLRAMFFVLNLVVFARVLRPIVSQYASEGEVTLYSYWFDLIPDALAEAFGAEHRIITRAHRFDLFDDQVPFRSRSLRRESLRTIDKVLTVSDDGRKYMVNAYPESADKIYVSTLGSRRVDNRVSQASVDGELTLLSVSRVTDVKRVDRCRDLAVAVANAYPWINVRWIHVGDGPLMRRLRKTVESSPLMPPNLTVDLKGALPNERVHEIYRNEPVDWFVLLSSSEGLPIAVCEALSYGVPVLASDVGGMSEAVTPDTGILLPYEANVSEYVGEMQPYISSRADFDALRRSARAHWDKYFDADICAVNLVKLVNHDR